MKSAYELAMERLEQEAPQVKLSEEQREALAEVEKKFKAKIAEKELFLGKLIAEAHGAGDLAELESLQRQLASEKSRLETEMEEAKEAVRSEMRE